MTQTQTIIDNSDRRLNWLMLLGITVIGFAIFSVVDYGNTTGKDDWFHLYRILILRGFIQSGGRPLRYLLLYPYAQLVGIGFPVERLALATARILTGYLVYRLVSLLRPKDQWFAVGCGILTTTFFVRSMFEFESILFNGPSRTASLLGLVALNLLAASLKISLENRTTSLLIAGAGAIVAWITTFVHELQVPLHIILPVLWVLFRKQRTRGELILLVIWYTGLLAGTIPVLWPIITGNRTSYSAKLFVDLQPARLFRDSIWQFDFAFHSFPLISFDEIYRPLPFLLVGILCVGSVIIAAHRALQRSTEPSQADWRTDIIWLFGSLISVWLGIAPFLPTIYARLGYHSHMMAQPAEAVVLASLLWFVTSWIPRDRVRWATRMLGLLLISVNGMVIVHLMQMELKHDQEATWENLSSFMRTLGSIAPDSDDPLVFVYLENRPQPETPFVYGWGLQYAVRYFSEDQATAIHLDDSNMGKWEVRNDGIWFEEPDRSHLYDWEHVIFITRSDLGEVVILDTIPESYATPQRQAAYNPYASIRAGYVPERIQAAFPVVRPPDFGVSD